MAKNSSVYKIPLTILLLAQFISALPFEVPFLGTIWLLWIIICVYYAFLTIKERNAIKDNLFGIILLLFWVLNAVSYYISPKIVQSIYVDVETLIIFKSITIALLSYFPFYYLTKHGVIQESSLKGFVLLLLVTSFLNVIFGNIVESKETMEEHNVVNQAYLFVQIIPLLMIFFQRKQLYILLAFACIMILWGAKRGAILCMAIELLVVFCYLLKDDNFGKRHRIAILMFFAIFLCVGVYFVLSNDFLQERLLNTGSDNDKSGDIRTERYLLLWSIYFNNSGANELLFGHGFAQTVSLGEGLAHQDWIELLIDNGLVGLFLYVFLIGYCLKYVLRWNTSLPKVYRYALLCCVLDWCLMATYSMVYASRENFILFSVLGLLIGLIQKDKKERLSYIH